MFMTSNIDGHAADAAAQPGAQPGPARADPAADRRDEDVPFVARRRRSRSSRSARVSSAWRSVMDSWKSRTFLPPSQAQLAG